MKIIHGFNCHMKIWKVWRDPQQGKQSTLWLDETKIQTPKEKSLKPGRIFLSHFPQCAFHGAWQNVKFTVLVTNRLELQHNNACSNSTSLKLLWPSARLRLSILRRVMQQLLAIQSSESGIAEDVGEMVFLVPGICLSNFLLASINGHATYTAACSQKKNEANKWWFQGFFSFFIFPKQNILCRCSVFSGFYLSDQILKLRSGADGTQSEATGACLWWKGLPFSQTGLCLSFSQISAAQTFIKEARRSSQRWCPPVDPVRGDKGGNPAGSPPPSNRLGSVQV